MGLWPFRRSRAQQDAERLLSAVIQVSRQPNFYGPDRVPDTLEGRFELMTLHAALALERLKAEPTLAPLAQQFTDRLFRHFDAGLREAGVGDLAVPKRIRKMAGAFYGRVKAYGEALAMGEAALADALARNVGVNDAFATVLAAYARASAAQQADAPHERLSRLDGWATAPA
jgi:cytochrome b pre-mRNA-processing protein 3